MLVRLLNALLRRAKSVDGIAHARRLRAMGNIEMGDNCSISPRAIITDPAYVRIGDNVRMSDCSLFGHDGSINMVNRMLGTTFDAVGAIVIGNNVFIGHGVILLPGTTIGNDVIIGAGSVVKGNVEGGYVYAGTPARRIRSMGEHVAYLQKLHEGLPAEWRDIVHARGREFDPAVEPRLIQLRRQHFAAQRAGGRGGDRSSMPGSAALGARSSIGQARAT
jgi:acetyltransferase-like isoleucine patch superfamily enzyme